MALDIKKVLDITVDTFSGAVPAKVIQDRFYPDLLLKLLLCPDQQRSGNTGVQKKPSTHLILVVERPPKMVT